MADVVRVTKGDQTYALFFPKDLSVEGVQFFTQQTDAFQLGLMDRAAGYEVKPHTHPSVERVLNTTSEFLYIETGKVRVTVFDDAWTSLATHELGAGDFLLFLRGGHGIEVLEDCRMIEVKQGPYVGDSASKTFRPQS